MAQPVTLDEYLERGEDALKYKLLDTFRMWGPKDYPGSVVVRWKAEYSAGAEMVCELTVRELPVSVMAIVEEIRKAIHEKWKGAPLISGVLDTRIARRGQKDSPDTLIRRIVPPESPENSELSYLRSELTYQRSCNQFLVAQMTQMSISNNGLIGQMGQNLQALATTRAATTSMADVSPVQLIIGMIVLPVMLPRINKLLGLRHDAPIDKVLTRVQALGSAGLERMLGDSGLLDEANTPPARQPQSVAELVEAGPTEAANQAPAEVEAEAVELPPAASSPAPAAPGWPAPAELVAHLASDDDYLDEVVSALLANPDATRVFLAKLGPLKSLLLGA